MAKVQKTPQRGQYGINIQNLASLYVNAGFDVNDRTFILGQSLADREAERVRDTISRERSTIVGSPAKRTNGNPFGYGWCTYYVKSVKPDAPSRGNAMQWPVNSDIPVKGGYVVMRSKMYPRYGHVAFVPDVFNGSFKVKEMNWLGFGKVSERVVSINDRSIVGFHN